MFYGLEMTLNWLYYTYSGLWRSLNIIILFLLYVTHWMATTASLWRRFPFKTQIKQSPLPSSFPCKERLAINPSIRGIFVYIWGANTFVKSICDLFCDHRIMGFSCFEKLNFEEFIKVQGFCGRLRRSQNSSISESDSATLLSGIWRNEYFLVTLKVLCNFFVIFFCKFFGFLKNSFGAL